MFLIKNKSGIENKMEQPEIVKRIFAAVVVVVVLFFY
jgi:hypothetical protein